MLLSGPFGLQSKKANSQTSCTITLYETPTFNKEEYKRLSGFSFKAALPNLKYKTFQNTNFGLCFFCSFSEILKI